MVPTFQIELNHKDEELLKLIQAYFEGVGAIHKSKNFVVYQVRSLEKIYKVIIPHFDRYPLITQKAADYMLWRQVIMMMVRKEHLKQDGLEKVIALKATLNKGLSDELKAAFPNTLPVKRPKVIDRVIRDPQWVAGFTSGEGCLLVIITKSLTKIGFRVLLTFQLTQHSRDEQLLRSFIEYFGRFAAQGLLAARRVWKLLFSFRV